MGINFGDVAASTAAPVSTPAAPVIQEVAAPSGGGFTLDLSKGAVLDLTKRNPGLCMCKLAAGWDAATASAGIDLDISAFLLDANGKVTSGADIVFFNNKTVPGVSLQGDNRTGDGEGDDEIIDIDLASVDQKYQRIVFVVSIFEAMQRRQTFGMVQNSYVRLLDAANNDHELCRYRLKDEYSSSTAVVFAQLKRNGSEWEFEAIGEGKVVADLNAIAAMYM